MCGHTISSKRFVVLCTKSIKIGGRITKLQSVEKWRVFSRHNKSNKFKHFSFSR